MRWIHAPWPQGNVPSGGALVPGRSVKRRFSARQERVARVLRRRLRGSGDSPAMLHGDYESVCGRGPVSQ